MPQTGSVCDYTSKLEVAFRAVPIDESLVPNLWIGAPIAVKVAPTRFQPNRLLFVLPSSLENKRVGRSLRLWTHTHTHTFDEKMKPISNDSDNERKESPRNERKERPRNERKECWDTRAVCQLPTKSWKTRTLGSKTPNRSDCAVHGRKIGGLPSRFQETSVMIGARRLKQQKNIKFQMFAFSPTLWVRRSEKTYRLSSFKFPTFCLISFLCVDWNGTTEAFILREKCYAFLIPSAVLIWVDTPESWKVGGRACILWFMPWSKRPQSWIRGKTSFDKVLE